MDKFKMAVEIQEKLDDLSRLVNSLTEEEFITKTVDKEEFKGIDWSEDICKKTYLSLAKQDLLCISKDKNNLKNSSHSVTVLIAQCFEKCLCHLLMLKGVKFVPTHSHSKLLKLVRDSYKDFPECFGEVEASLCELWYQTNRYPQRSQRGYENYYLILNMIKLCERLVDYTENCDKRCKGIEFDFTEYEASRLLNDLEIGEVITKQTFKKKNQEGKGYHRNNERKRKYEDD